MAFTKMRKHARLKIFSLMKSVLLSISFSMFISSVFAQVSFSTDPIRVNEKRIEQRIQEFAKFGINELGQPFRVAYSQGDIEGRAYFIDLMKKAGLEVQIDFAGNIIGKRAGKDPSKKPIAFGSHIDMVPNGGNYDGTLGSFTALEIIEVLNEHNVITNHP